LPALGRLPRTLWNSGESIGGDEGVSQRCFPVETSTRAVTLFPSEVEEQSINPDPSARMFAVRFHFFSVESYPGLSRGSTAPSLLIQCSVLAWLPAAAIVS